ncbi:MAG: serine/threonine protein kinase [Deltaproteobacteria bacterium]|nr:serine/threonine protein kinase [Deltaproteobacteria bacterium]
MAGDESRQFGKYRLIARLATGGMAEIYLASQTSLAGFEKLIVIKRILPNLAREERFVRMFLDEARIAAMLNHPNVVQIFDLGRIGGQLFIAMEYLSGESLAMIIRACRGRNMRVPPHLVAGIMLQAAEGLHHAHSALGPDGQPLQIIHRDISPQNVFALYDGGVKVVDFGIAKATLRSTKTRTGMLKGKYAYMSPEQILAVKDLDARSDVFALGVVMWELLCCRKLYSMESDLKLLKAITEHDAPSPASFDPELPEYLCTIVRQALARDRDERYASAADMRADLADFLKQCPESGDTIAIKAFMQDLFAKRIQTKRRLIEGAQAGSQDLDDCLFADISQYLSDTEHSVPHTTPPPVGRTLISPARSRGLWLWLLGIPVLGLGVLGGLLWGWSSPEPAPMVDAGIASVDGARQAAAGPVANGAPDAGAAASDAGLAAAPADPAPARVASLGDPAAVRTPPGKFKRRRRLRRRRKIDAPDKPVAPDPIKPEPKADGPPGKLRLMTSPWTEIFYQGRKLGQTPLIDVELPPGKIQLRAVNKEAGIDRVLTVTIKPGERITRRFNLF